MDYLAIQKYPIHKSGTLQHSLTLLTTQYLLAKPRKVKEL